MNIINHTGPIPEKFYRYRSVRQTNIDYLIDFEINKEGLYLAGLDELNDKIEGRINLHFSSTPEKQTEFWRHLLLKEGKANNFTTILDASQRTALYLKNPQIAMSGVNNRYWGIGRKLIRVACFTTKPTNAAMWASYAKYYDENNISTDNAGICIEYAFDESIRNQPFAPVIYSDEVPQFDPSTQEESELVKAIYTKGTDWSYEQEWRYASILQIDPNAPIPENYKENSKIHAEKSVRSIIFGLDTPKVAIKHITSKTKINGIIFKKIEMKGQKYHIIEI